MATSSESGAVTEGTSESRSTDRDEVTVREAFEFFAERSATEAEQFEADEGRDVPQHAETLVVDAANDVLRTITSARMARDMAEEGEDTKEEAMNESITDAIVDLFAAIGTLKFEEDIDVASAVAGRMSFIEDYEAFEQAMRDADTPDEKEKVMDEYLTDEIAEEIGVQTGVQSGDNVDNDDYDPNAVDRTYQ